MKTQLLGARRMLEKCGWVGPKLEPWCRDSRGRRVHHSDGAVQSFALSGALQLYGPLEPAWKFLHRVISPRLAELGDWLLAYTVPVDELEWRPFLTAAFGGDEDRGRWVDLAGELQLEQFEARAGGEFLSFGGWLTSPARTREDVLRTLTTATLRSAREKRT